MLLLPSAIHAFVAPTQNLQLYKQSHPTTRLYQQQPYYNEADGQYYYYNSSNGNYYSETGQMWIQQDYSQDYDQGYQQNYDQQGEYTQPSLILNDIQSEMSAIAAEAGLDYLSLARQRAAEKRESVNISTDRDWLNLADEIKKKAGDDGWEASLDDEGSEGDAAALGMRTFVTEGGIVVEGGDGDEPTLLL
jgi:hypothetical protein